jgi:hypothetical protein
MKATNAHFSLQLIVESFSTGVKQVASATIRIDSFKFEEASTLDKTPIELASQGAQFAQNSYQPSNLNSFQLIVNLISNKWVSTNIFDGKPSKLIVYSKISFHFCKDCRIFCEEE